MGVTILAFEGESPRIHKTAYLADGVAVIGRVEIGGQAGIWFNAVLRGDAEPIRIGRGTNVQDGTVVHTDPGYPCSVADFVTVGHGAILHGCTVEQGATIGMGATVLNGARVGEEALVAANALVPEGMEVPPRTLVAGVPARPRRELTAAEVARLRENAEWYIRRQAAYLSERET